MTTSEASAAGAALVAQRRLVELVCSVCGVEYRGRQIKGELPRYCSSKCKWTAINARRRGKILKKPA